MHIFYNTFRPLNCVHYLKCGVSIYITYFELLPKMFGTLNDYFITNLHIKLLCTVLVPFLASSLWCVIVPVCGSSSSTCSPSCFCNCCCCCCLFVCCICTYCLSNISLSSLLLYTLFIYGFIFNFSPFSRCHSWKATMYYTLSPVYRWSYCPLVWQEQNRYT